MLCPLGAECPPEEEALSQDKQKQMQRRVCDAAGTSESGLLCVVVLLQALQWPAPLALLKTLLSPVGERKARLLCLAREDGVFGFDTCEPLQSYFLVLGCFLGLFSHMELRI